MLRDALRLAWNDFRLMMREREIVMWAFVLPVVFFYFVGVITRGFGGDDSAPDTIAVYSPEDAGFLVDDLTRRLESGHFRVVRVARAEELEQYQRRLTVPRLFTDQVLAGVPVELTASRREEGMQTDYDDVRLARAVFSMVGDYIVVKEQGGEVDPASLADVRARPRMLSVNTIPAGQRREPPRGFDQSVPGSMVFLVLVVLTTSGVTLTAERVRGMLRRLAWSPMTRGSVVAGKWGARVLLGMVQVAFAMVVGALFFGVKWGPHWPTVVVVLMAYVALGAALGMLLGNVARTPGQVIAAGAIAANLLGALGGCWGPIEVPPELNQRLARFLPTGAAMDALHRLLLFGDGPVDVIPHIVALSLGAAAAGWLLSRWFRFM